MPSSPTRRTLIAGSAAALCAPRRALGADRGTLRFVPRTDLGVLDPIRSSAIITRNHAFMVYDTLYGQNADFDPSPQMVAVIGLKPTAVSGASRCATG